MKKTLLTLLTLALMSTLWYSCQRETAGEQIGLVELKPSLPTHPLSYNVMAVNQGIASQQGFINDNLATLGRVLFYDNALSVNNSLSCASCHFQTNAFSDKVALSTGFSGKLTARNSLPIFNGRPNNDYFWDIRTQGLNAMVIEPVQHSVEMGFDNIDNVIYKLGKTDYYTTLFTNAFGTNQISKETISMALAEFVRSMVSGSAKFDRNINTQFAEFTAQEELGRQLFFDKLHCATCHGGGNFNNEFTFDPGGGGGGGGWGGGGGGGGGAGSLASIANIGLEMVYTDKGVSPEKQATNRNQFQNEGEGFFKIPSLRNVAVTGPYMHDGRFATLEDVIEHYNSGIVNHPALDVRLKPHDEDPVTGAISNVQNKPMRLNLTPVEKKALVAFLKTLTDESLITAERFSNPFRPVQ